MVLRAAATCNASVPLPNTPFASSSSSSSSSSLASSLSSAPSLTTTTSTTTYSKGRIRTRMQGRIVLEEDQQDEMYLTMHRTTRTTSPAKREEEEEEASVDEDQVSAFSMDADQDVLMRTPLGRMTNVLWTRRGSSTSSISSIGSPTTKARASMTSTSTSTSKRVFGKENHLNTMMATSVNNSSSSSSSSGTMHTPPLRDGSSLDFSAKLLKRLSLQSNQTATPEHEDSRVDEDADVDEEQEEQEEEEDRGDGELEQQEEDTEEEEEEEEEEAEQGTPLKPQQQQRVQLLTPLNCVTQEKIRRQQLQEEKDHEQQQQRQRQLRKRRPSASPSLHAEMHGRHELNAMVFSHPMEPHPESRVSSARRAWKRHSHSRRPLTPPQVTTYPLAESHPVHGRVVFAAPSHGPVVAACRCECPDVQPKRYSPASHANGDMDHQELVIRKGLTRQLEQESLGTLIVYQPTCLDHHNDTHQENRERLKVLCGPDGVLQMERFRDLKWANLKQLQPARLCDLLRVHTFDYVQHLEKTCAALPEQDPRISVGRLYPANNSDALSSGPERKTRQSRQHPDSEASDGDYASWLQSSKAALCYEVENPPSSGFFDMDSPISRSSYEVARLAAGAVCHAIDKVVHLETRNAFVVVRPPGHHAGPNGCVESDGFHRRPEMCTCGFCLLNNVAIGAAYAMDMYGGTRYGAIERRRSVPRIDKVAIIDFDIHHGNGTEEIIRNLIPHTQNYPLPSSWAPISFNSYKPWRDENDVENVFFGSIHLYDDDNFYPCSGVGPHGGSKELEHRPNIVNLPLELLGPKYLEERLKLTQKARRSLMEQASRTFRRKVSNQLLPALRRFEPDLILVSAGFDGHADDFYYFLSEDDYGWITEKLVGVAEECCDGRIVSVLEGGYNVEASHAQKPTTNHRRKTSNSNFHFAAELHHRELDQELAGYGSLARSCVAHVTALQEAATR